MFSSVDLNLLLNFVILIFTVMAAMASVVSKNLVTSIIFLSLFSMLMALEYLLLGAPDVALTESTVGAGVSTVILLTLLWIVGDKEKSYKFNPSYLLLFVVVGIVIIFITSDMNFFATKNNLEPSSVAQYYLHHTHKDTGIDNAVTAILASYRGYDTFGELVVIFTALTVILTLLQTKRR